VNHFWIKASVDVNVFKDTGCTQKDCGHYSW